MKSQSQDKWGSLWRLSRGYLALLDTPPCAHNISQNQYDCCLLHCRKALNELGGEFPQLCLGGKKKLQSIVRQAYAHYTPVLPIPKPVDIPVVNHPLDHSGGGASRY